MATSMLDDVPRFARAAIESLGPEDFETASVRSIRSAAPSYSKSRCRVKLSLSSP